MTCIQELILDTMVRAMPSKAHKNEPSPFASGEELAADVKSQLYFLKEEFFTRPWQETGLDTPERRRFLRGQMDEAINRQGENLGYMPLFKKKG